MAKIVGRKLYFSIKHRGRRWRGPCDVYIAPRQHDPAWRARCGLSADARLTERRTIERFVEPQARLEWMAYVGGTGPDPRQPPTATADRLTVGDVLTGWYAYRTNPKHPKPLRAVYSVGPRVASLIRRLGGRPADGLAQVATYDALKAHDISSVLRPAFNWATAQTPPLIRLTGRSPFGLHRVRSAASKKRDVVITAEQVASIDAAFAASVHPDSPRVQAFCGWLRMTGARPWELASVQAGDIDWARHLVRLNVTKSGRARQIPFDVTDPCVRWAERCRAGPAATYIFAPAGRVLPTPPTALVGRSLADSMRYRWRSAVATAGLANEDIVMRDWRRWTATGWRTAGLPKEDRSYMLGHRGDVTDLYSVAELQALRGRLELLVWRP